MKKYLILIVNLLWIIGVYYGIIQFSFFIVDFIGQQNESFRVWHQQNGLFPIIINDILDAGLFYVLFRVIKKERLYKKLNFKNIDRPNTVVAVVLGLLMGLFTVTSSQLSFIKNTFPDLDGILKFLFESSSVPMFLIFLLVGSVYKEVFFRGIIFNELRRALPVSVAMVIQAFFYCLLFFTLNPILSVYGFSGSIIFAILYYKSGSISISAIAWFFCQGIQFVLYRAGIGTIPQPALMAIAIPSCIAAIVILVIYATRKSKPQSEVPAQPGEGMPETEGGR